MTSADLAAFVAATWALGPEAVAIVALPLLVFVLVRRSAVSVSRIRPLTAVTSVAPLEDGAVWLWVLAGFTVAIARSRHRRSTI